MPRTLQQHQPVRPMASTTGCPSVRSYAKHSWLTTLSICAPRSCSCPGISNTMMTANRRHPAHCAAAAVAVAAVAPVRAAALLMRMKIGSRAATAAHLPTPSARSSCQHQPAAQLRRPRSVHAPMDVALRIVRYVKRSRTKMPPHAIVKRKSRKWRKSSARSRSCCRPMKR